MFTNDPVWAACITAPEAALDKTYHVQIDRLPDEGFLERIANGSDSRVLDLSPKSVRCLRRGVKNAWLEIVLDEGRNRHIRRLLAAVDAAVLRLVRVAIGSLPLGDLGRGQWRELGEDEIQRLKPAAAPPPARPPGIG